MAEGKKRLYKRDTAHRHLNELIDRVQEVIENKESSIWIDEFTNVVVFGSLVNTNNDRVHDVDVAVDTVRRKDAQDWEDWVIENIPWQRACHMCFTDRLLASYYELLKYIKNGSGIISLHSYSLEKSAVESDTHYFIVKDGKLQYDTIKKLKEA